MPYINEKAFLENYEMKGILGTGAFSQVRLAVDKTTGVEVAIKIIDKTKC